MLSTWAISYSWFLLVRGSSHIEALNTEGTKPWSQRPEGSGWAAQMIMQHDTSEMNPLVTMEKKQLGTVSWELRIKPARSPCGSPLPPHHEIDPIHLGNLSETWTPAECACTFLETHLALQPAHVACRVGDVWQRQIAQTQLKGDCLALCSLKCCLIVVHHGNLDTSNESHHYKPVW